MFKLKKKRLFFLALIIFLLINLGAIFFSWQGRNVPLEPDDSGIYLTFIQANKKYSSIFSRQVKVFDHPVMWDEYGGADKTTFFSWGFFWGKIAKLTSIEAETAFKLSFYFGIIFFLLTLLYFFKEKGWQLKVILVLTFSFFTGDGIYHGFCWPVASFYATTLYLLIVKIIFQGEKNWFRKMIFISPIFFLTHSLATVYLAGLVIYLPLSLYFLKSKDSKTRTRVLSLLIAGLTFYLFWFKFLIFKNVDLVKNTNIILSIISRLQSHEYLLYKKSALLIFDKYFLTILTRPLFLTLFILGLIETYKKEKKLLLLYISFFLLIMAGLFFPGGERIMLIAWVLTFIIFSFGLNYLISLAAKILKKQLSFKKQKKLIMLLLTNFFLEASFLAFILKPNSSKNIILEKFFIYSKIIILAITLTTLLFNKKAILSKLILRWLFISLASFFIYLFLEKAAMVVFLKNRNNYQFDKKIFLSEIETQKTGTIIYNDKISFALFSGLGLIEKEAIKKDYLTTSYLNRASYFIASRAKFDHCQKQYCWLEMNNVKRKMELKAKDNNFLLYKF